MWLCGTGRALGALEVRQPRQSPDGKRGPRGHVGAVGRSEAGPARGPAWPSAALVQPQTLRNLPSESPDHAIHQKE